MKTLNLHSGYVIADPVVISFITGDNTRMLDPKRRLGKHVLFHSRGAVSAPRVTRARTGVVRSAELLAIQIH